MYEGSSDNPGKTREERAEACATACREKKKPLNYKSWEGFTARGFIVDDGGRCYCESADSATCKRADSSYRRYDFVEADTLYRGLQLCQGHCETGRDCEGNLQCFDTGPNKKPVPGCTGTPSRSNLGVCHIPKSIYELGYKRASEGEFAGKSGKGECTGPELRMYEGSGDNPGKTREERVEACATACRAQKKPLNNKSWKGFTARGFVVQNDGRCYCESADSATCKRVDNSYTRYDFVDSVFPYSNFVDVENIGQRKVRQPYARCASKIQLKTELMKNIWGDDDCNRWVNENPISCTWGNYKENCAKKCTELKNIWGDDDCNRWVNENPISCTWGNYKENCAKKCTELTCGAIKDASNCILSECEWTTRGYTKHSDKSCWGVYKSSQGRMGYEGPGSSTRVRKGQRHSPMTHRKANTVAKCQKLCDEDATCQAINFHPRKKLCYTYTGHHNKTRLTKDPQNGVCTAQSAKFQKNYYDLYLKPHNASFCADTYVTSKGKGYEYSTKKQAKDACEASGLRLCAKHEVIDKDICSYGWTSDADTGYPMAHGIAFYDHRANHKDPNMRRAKSYCGGRKDGWRNGGQRKAKAFCCAAGPERKKHRLIEGKISHDNTDYADNTRLLVKKCDNNLSFEWFWKHRHQKQNIDCVHENGKLNCNIDQRYGAQQGIEPYYNTFTMEDPRSGVWGRNGPNAGKFTLNEDL